MASKQTLDHSVLAPFNSRVAYSGSGKNVRSVDWLGRAPKESITARRISGGCGQFEKLHRSHLLGNGDRRWGQTYAGNEQGRETLGNSILQNYNSWPLSVKKPTHVHSQGVTQCSILNLRTTRFGDALFQEDYRCAAPAGEV
jgi:hypothetical protein